MSRPSQVDLDLAASKGATLLDERRPTWRGELADHRLSFDNRWDCILGQLFGDFHAGVKELDVDPIEFGFVCDQYAAIAECYCSDLQDAWVRMLTPG